MWWKKWLVYVLFPLFFGALIYWLTRGQSPPIFLRWLHFPSAPIDLSPFLPQFLISSFPSFCWTFSLAAALFLIWRANDKEHKIWLGSIAFIGSVLFEVMQAISFFPGTFDWLDIVASGLATAFVFYLSKNFRHE